MHLIEYIMFLKDLVREKVGEKMKIITYTQVSWSQKLKTVYLNFSFNCGSYILFRNTKLSPSPQGPQNKKFDAFLTSKFLPTFKIKQCCKPRKHNLLQ